MPLSSPKAPPVRCFAAIHAHPRRIASCRASLSWRSASRAGEGGSPATDARGTVIASEDGAPMLATPYGARAARPELSRAIDYVEQGYDADLGTVRMGVRDYDDRLGQFWTPDPLYLEQLGQCAESPVECNLYGYALGNPLSFVDPTGLGGETIRWVADSEDEDRVVALAPEDEVVDHTRPSNAALWNFTDALVRDINGWVGGTAWGRDASNAWTSVPGPYYSLDTAEVTGDLRGLLRQGFSPLADLSAQRNISLDCWSLFSFDASMGAELVLVNRVELTGPGTVGVSPRETRGMQTDSSQLSGSAKVDLERARVDGGTKLTASGSAGVTYGSSSQTQTQTTLGSTAPGVIWQGQLGVRISYTDSNGVSQSIVAVLPRTVQVRVREESRYAP